VIRRFLMLMCAVVLMIGPAIAENLNAAGATFPNPIYQKWFSEYHNAHPDVEINYQGVGSGAGIRQLMSGTVDFGASDGPMTDQQLAEAKFKIFHIPRGRGPGL
jgi:phosphate transport system substrate-binding protein